MKTRFVLAVVAVIIALSFTSCVVRQAGQHRGVMMSGGPGPQFEEDGGGYYGQPVHRGRVAFRDDDQQPARVASTQGGGNRREFEGVLRQKRDANGNPVGEPEFIPAGDSRLHDPLARRRPDSEAVKLDGQGKVTELPGHLDRAAMDKIFDHIESKGGKTLEDVGKGRNWKTSGGIKPTHETPTKLPPSPGSEDNEDEETCPSAAPKGSAMGEHYVNS